MREFNTSFSKYTPVPTGDGSVTYLSHHFGETLHSESGAVLETQKYYIENTGLLTKAKKLDRPIRLLEVGVGLGIGLSESMRILKQQDLPLSYVGLEIDAELAKRALSQFPKINPADIASTEHGLCCKHGGIEINILIGDARKTLKKYKQEYSANTFDVIFQDPFSPPKNPSLWTVEWFELLAQLAHPGSTLATYSASSCVRKALALTGWGLAEGGGFGKKKSSTKAVFAGPHTAELALQLERSPIAALTDLDCKPH